MSEPQKTQKREPMPGALDATGSSNEVEGSEVYEYAAEFDASSAAGLQLQTSATVPACEASPASPASPTAQVRALVLSFLDYPDADVLQRSACGPRFSVTFRHVSSIQQYRKVLETFVTDCKSMKVADLWILHVLTTTADNQPVIGGKVVSETELYGPLNSFADDQSVTARVLQLTCQLQDNQNSKLSESVRGCSYECEADFVLPKRASFCGTEFYRIPVPIGANLLKVHEVLGQAFNALETGGSEATVDEMIQQIENCCSSSKLQLVQTSGVPDGAVTVVSHPQDIPAIPDVPSVPEETSCNFRQLLNKSPTECEQTPTNICVGCIVTNYGSSDEEDRDGSDKDCSHITETAQHLGCSTGDIHVLCPDDGRVSKDQVLQFNEQVVRMYEGKTLVRNVFLVVSAHGSKSGFKTSAGEEVQVRELVEPLLRLGGFVLMFYQPCRGRRCQSAGGVEADQHAFISGITFYAPDTSGCCLPPNLSNCAAIFGSMAGYESYRTTVEGSLMLKAVRDVVVGQRRTVSVKQLAELVQQRLHAMRPDGLVRTRRSGLSYVQIQFTVQGGRESAIELGVRQDEG